MITSFDQLKRFGIRKTSKHYPPAMTECEDGEFVKVSELSKLFDAYQLTVRDVIIAIYASFPDEGYWGVYVGAEVDDVKSFEPTIDSEGWLLQWDGKQWIERYTMRGNLKTYGTTLGANLIDRPALFCLGMFGDKFDNYVNEWVKK